MIRRGTALLVVALGTGLLPSPPAAASSTGEVVFQCNFSAPAWPTPHALGSCDGTAVVSVSGIDDLGTPYTLAGPAPFSMRFDYGVACIAAEPPLLWDGDGEITVGPVPAVRGSVVTQAVLTANVAITGSTGPSAFQTNGHQVQFADGATASGLAPGFGEFMLGPALTPANVCPVGGPIQGVAAGTWHLVM